MDLLEISVFKVKQNIKISATLFSIF